MARVIRSDLPDGFFHVTANAVHGAKVYADDEDRLEFLELLAESVARFGWRCIAYSLMGTHYHLLLETTVEQLARGLHRLNGVYAQRFNRRHDRKGHLFRDRYSAWVIEDEDHAVATIGYILHNPVHAGLCETPQEWRWSGVDTTSANTCSRPIDGDTLDRLWLRTSS